MYKTWNKFKPDNVVLHQMVSVDVWSLADRLIHGSVVCTALLVLPVVSKYVKIKPPSDYTF